MNPMPLLSVVNAVGWGAVITALILGVANHWYPTVCFRQAEKLKCKDFGDDTFYVSKPAWFRSVFLMALGGWFVKAAIDSIGARMYLGLLCGCFSLFVGIFMAYEDKRTIARFSNGEFLFREGNNFSSVLLMEIREVKLGLGGAIEVHHGEQGVLRVPITLERLPKVIAMLKYYRPAHDKVGLNC